LADPTQAQHPNRSRGHHRESATLREGFPPRGGDWGRRGKRSCITWDSDFPNSGHRTSKTGALHKSERVQLGGSRASVKRFSSGAAHPKVAFERSYQRPLRTHCATVVGPNLSKPSAISTTSRRAAPEENWISLRANSISTTSLRAHAISTTTASPRELNWPSDKPLKRTPSRPCACVLAHAHGGYEKLSMLRDEQFLPAHLVPTPGSSLRLQHPKLAPAHAVYAIYGRLARR
jgi:hypothetical protein